jgi:hypothetical protein
MPQKDSAEKAVRKSIDVSREDQTLEIATQEEREPT